jgi:hypothetical protein
MEVYAPFHCSSKSNTFPFCLDQSIATYASNLLFPITMIIQEYVDYKGVAAGGAKEVTLPIAIRRMTSSLGARAAVAIVMVSLAFPRFSV